MAASTTASATSAPASTADTGAAAVSSATAPTTIWAATTDTSTTAATPASMGVPADKASLATPVPAPIAAGTSTAAPASTATTSPTAAAATSQPAEPTLRQLVGVRRRPATATASPATERVQRITVERVRRTTVERRLDSPAATPLRRREALRPRRLAPSPAATRPRRREALQPRRLALSPAATPPRRREALQPRRLGRSPVAHRPTPAAAAAAPAAAVVDAVVAADAGKRRSGGTQRAGGAISSPRSFWCRSVGRRARRSTAVALCEPDDDPCNSLQRPNSRQSPRLLSHLCSLFRIPQQPAQSLQQRRRGRVALQQHCRRTRLHQDLGIFALVIVRCGREWHQQRRSARRAQLRDGASRPRQDQVDRKSVPQGKSADL